MSNEKNSEENSSEENLPNENNSKTDEKHKPQSKMGIMIEILLSLAFFIPALILSFSETILLIFAVIFSMLSVLYMRLNQMSKNSLPKTEYDNEIKKSLILCILLVIASILCFIFALITSSDDIGIFYLTLVGIIIGLRIWIIILLFILTSTTS